MNRATLDAPVPFTHVLESTGYYSGGEPAPGLIATKSLEAPANADKLFRYATVIKNLEPSAIYELSGSPCFFFKWVDAEPDRRDLTRWHRIAWNNGLAPVLWVVTPAAILLYDCFSRPDPHGTPDSALIETFENTAAGLAQLSRIAGRMQVESGEFWASSRAGRIDRNKRIDAELLRDISATEKQLTKAGLSLQFSHELITKSIFFAYLQDRRILTPEFLQANFGHQTLIDALLVKGGAQVFEWLRATFNGDLFAATPESATERNGSKDLKPAHVEVVREFLTGTEMTSGQRRIWPYDFSVIPIELISSIYEMFAYSGDSSSARQKSTHYTPINLVDTVLSHVFSDPSPKSRVLDMACGSGVFLVESFRRIVGQRVISGEPWNRETVRTTLYGQIFGIDVNPEAIRIAMFSLYLTALELDPDPQPPAALKFKPLIGSNLLVGDAFPTNADQIFRGEKFDAIVGNPPWSRRAENQSPAGYCRARALPLARFDTPDQAFLWRALDFAKPGAIVGFIMHGKPLFSHTSDAQAVRSHLVRSFKPRILLNLAALRREKVFPNTTAPAMILVAEVGASHENTKAALIAPRRDVTFRQHGVLEIESDDVKEIKAQSIATDQNLLKVASWGSPRDLLLIRRLRTFPTIGDLLSQRKEKGWAAGQGLQVAGGTNPAPKLRGKPFLQAGDLPPFQLHPRTLDAFGTQLLHRPRDMKIYRGPLVISPRGMNGPSFRAAFCESDVVFSEMYFGIAIPNSEVRWAHYLNALLNSEVATYFLFMTGSSWGVERDEVKPEDLLSFPVPRIEEVDGSVLKRLLSTENVLRSNVRTDSMRKLNELVREIYAIDESECYLIEDLVQRRIPAWYSGSAGFVPVTRAQLKAYTDVVVTAMDSLLSARGERRIVAEAFDGPLSNLQIVRLRSIPRRHKVRRSGLTKEDLSSALQKIQAALNQEHSGFTVRRVLRVYVNQEVFIVKPADARYWERSKALSDVDAIITEHIQYN